MKRIAMTLGLLLLAAAPANAQQVTGIEISDAGIYTADTAQRRAGADGIDSATVTNLKLAVATTSVPLQRHVQFGFRYHIKGAPEGTTVSIREVNLFPAPGLRPPGKAAVLASPEVKNLKIGVTTYTGYGIDETWEMVPGKWTFQIWVGNRKMAEQSFTVVAQ